MGYVVIPRGPVWFVADGRMWWGPWRTLWAAQRCAWVLSERKAYEERQKCGS